MMIRIRYVLCIEEYRKIFRALAFIKTDPRINSP